MRACVCVYVLNSPEKEVLGKKEERCFKTVQNKLEGTEGGVGFMSQCPTFLHNLYTSLNDWFTC